MSTDERTAAKPVLAFRHQTGGINARFSHSTFDYIELDLRLGGETTWVQEMEPSTFRALGEERRIAKPSVEHTVYFSSVFCAFPSYIRFLEAITIGVEECAFSWDPEGPFGRMHWKSSGGEEGMFRIQWSSGEWKFDQTTHLRALDVVETLYSAFRSFVESPEYEPLRYEYMCVWDTYSLVLADAGLGDFARAVARLPSTEAGAALARASAMVESRKSDASVPPARSHPLEWFLHARRDVDGWRHDLPLAWDTWSEARRKRYLGRLWARPYASAWYGAGLRRLRSAQIEGWLAQKRRASR